MIIQACFPLCAWLITLQSSGKLRPKFDLLHMCLGNGELATYFDQITVVKLSKVTTNTWMKELVITYVGVNVLFI